MGTRAVNTGLLQRCVGWTTSVNSTS